MDTKKKPEAKENPDLRHGLHGTVMSNSIDAGRSASLTPSPSDDLLKPATPDQQVPAGQVTHE